LVLGLSLAALFAHADAATITVVNNDGPGEGFNDPTVVSPVGGNPGTTLGAQRLNAFQFAANIWAAQLTSSVTIFVDATMDPLFCDSTSATLGQAGASSYLRDFPGALVAGTWYPQALANKLSGADLDPGNDDIIAQFNSSVGTTCPFPNVWYYGFDANPPVGDFDFVTVVLHELGHGLGFQTIVDLTTGAKALGFDDTFMRNLEDKSVGLLWPPMSDAQRQASAIDDGDLYWTGAQVIANSGFLTSGRDGSGNVLMYAPNPLQQGSNVSHFDTTLSPDQLLEPIYTGPNHNPQLAIDVLDDIGWSGAPTTTTTTTSTTTTTLPPVATCGASPIGGCLSPGAATLQVNEKTVGKEKLKVALKKLTTATAQGTFGNPVGGTTSYAICVYDQGATLRAQMQVNRAGQLCGTKACWSAISTKGFKYTDKTASADGISKITGKGGDPTKGQIQAQGQNNASKGQTALPTGIAAALQNNTQATVQILTSDASCFGATFTHVTEADGLEFKAVVP
jgi:hypothetical protein